MIQQSKKAWQMDEHNWLAKQFEKRRARLRADAYRMLGLPGEAENAD